MLHSDKQLVDGELVPVAKAGTGFDFLELVNTEDTPHISTGRPSFFTEAGRVTGVFDRQLGLRRVKPLFGVEGGDGLFRGSDKVFFVFVSDDLYRTGILSVGGNLIEAYMHEGPCIVLRRTGRVVQSWP